MTKSAIAFYLVLALFILLTTKSEITRAGNESSRLAATQCLVEHGTFSIDSSTFTTVDRVRIGEHFYSDKPLLPICWLGAIYGSLHHIYSLDFAQSRATAIRLVTFFGVGSFSILLAYLFRRKVEPLRLSTTWKWVASAGVVLTTWIFSYGTTVNNHTPAACILFALFCLLDGHAAKLSPKRALCAGLLAGALFNWDFPTGGIFFAGIAVMLFFVHPQRWKVLPPYIAGFGALFCAMLLVDFLAYGNVLPPYLIPGAQNFPGNIHTQLYGGQTRPLNLPIYAFDISLGKRGLFSYLPVLLLAFPVFWNRSGKNRKETLSFAIILAVVFGYYACQTGEYGGWAYGFRYLIPIIPILFWYSVVWLSEGEGLARRVVFAVALGIGFITSAVGAYNPWPVAYGGALERPGTAQQIVRSTFSANLFCMAFQANPYSWLSGTFIERIYGPKVSRAYLQMAYLNMRRPDLIARVNSHIARASPLESLEPASGAAP